MWGGLVNPRPIGNRPAGVQPAGLPGGQAFTTVAFFTKSGSNSTPRPWPVGSGMTPFLISKFGVYQVSFLAAARETYSIQGPTFGVVAARETYSIQGPT